MNLSEKTETFFHHSSAQQNPQLMMYRNHSRVLIIEDDQWIEPILSRAIREALPDSEVQVDWALSVESAKAKLWDNEYALVIADVFLEGDQDGLDVWRYCQKYFPDLPVLVTSSLSPEAFFRRVGQGEISPAFLPKPFRIGECRQMIQGLTEYGVVPP
jgi:DNA-binding NtrC family response regulator